MPMLGIMASSMQGAVGDYESISTTTLSTATASVTFSSIPATYKHLQIRWIAKGTTGSLGYAPLIFNSDTATNYSYHTLYGSGTAAATDVGTTVAYAVAGIYGGTTNIYAANVLDILDYANTNKYKTTRVLNGVDINAAGGYVEFTSSSWRSTSAISTITITTQSPDNFEIYSSFALYGVK